MNTTNAVKKASKPAKPRVYLRVIEGGLIPVDQYALSQLREKNYRVGDVVSAELKKLNNPELHRRLFRIARLCIANIASFQSMDPHQALKRIQWEADIACEEITVLLPGAGAAKMRFPASLAYDAMDEGLRQQVTRAICRHISQTYWPALAPKEIEHLAGWGHGARAPI